MPKLKGQRLKKIKIDNKPLWGGPEEEGITQSMIQNFLRCRERFRLKVIEGLGPVESFVKAIEYGNLWHACEEEIAFPQGEGVGWEKRLLQEAQKLCKKFPTQQEEIDKWYNVCKVQFPVYREFWKNSKSAKADALQWVSESKLRVVLEHMTSELLQKQPDEPLEFLVDVLQQGQADDAAGAAERPATSASARLTSSAETEAEVLAGFRAERDHWKGKFEAEAAKAVALRAEIVELEQQLQAASATPAPSES